MKIKKGELTTQQLVTIIVLIVSFIVILTLLWRLNLGDVTDKEICHNSVAMKGQVKLGSGPLDCKTNYVCISGGGKCEEFNPSNTIDINMKQKEEDVKKDILKAVADEMVDCWWMFGEGKVDYVGLGVESATIGKVNCALCSIISFDEKIKNDENLNKEKISYKRFYGDYLTSYKKDGKSYLYYLYGIGIGDIEKIGLPDEKIDFSKQYSVLTGIHKEGSFWKPFNFVRSFFVDDKGKKRDTGSLPVIIKKKEDISKLGCDEFITKA